MAKTLGELDIILRAQTAGFVAGMNQAMGQLKAADKTTTDTGSRIARLGTTFTRVGNAAAAASKSMVLSLTSVAKKLTVVTAVISAVGYLTARPLLNAAEQVDQLGKSSKVLGLTIEQLSVLRLAAGEAGVEFGTLSTMVGKAQREIGQLVQDGQSRLKLGQTTIELRRLNGEVRPIFELLPEIAAAISAVQDEASQIELATQVFGKSGATEFLTLLKDGGDYLSNIADQTERASKLNVLFNDVQVRKLTAFNDALGRIGEAFFGLSVQVMTELAPTFTLWADSAALQIGKIGRFMANVMRIIGEAWDGPNAAAARDALMTGGTAIVDAIGTHIWTRLKVVGSWVISSLTSLVAAGLDTLSQVMLVAAENSVDLISRSILRSLANVSVGLAKISQQASQFDWPAYIAQITAEQEAANKSFVWGVDYLNQMGAGYRATADGANEAAPAVKKVAQAMGDIEKRIQVTPEPVFFDGIVKAVSDAAAKVREISTLGENVTSTLISGFSSGVGDVVVDATNNISNFGTAAVKVFEDVGKSVAKMVIEFYAARAITGLLAMVDPLSFGGTPAFDGFTGPLRKNGNMAMGGAFDGGVQRLAQGGIVTRPTEFNSLSGRKLMGEAGPEAIMPLQRIGGKLGVAAAGGGTTVQVIDQRGSGAAPQVSQGRGADGRMMIKVLIRDEVRNLVGDGSLDKAMGLSFGLKRQPTAR